MPRLLPKGFALAIAVMLAGALPVCAQNKKGGEPVALDVRITLLVSHLADQARLSEDLAFAVRAQSQAATLLWSYDCERARAIFRQAFQSLARETLSQSDRRQLREELLNRIASRDTELAEELARALAYSADISKETRADAERRELLISVALQIVERDPYRAMALGQLSLGSPAASNREDGALISQNFARLLVLMRAVDAGLSDLLFSSAVIRLERAQAINLDDIHTLGSYLVSSVNSSSKDSISRHAIERFLSLAFNQIMLHRNSEERGRPDEAAVYFITRQLTDLFARYMPDRFKRVQRKIDEMNEASASDRTTDLGLAQPTSPADIAVDARASSNESERDSLYARAALGWLAKGEMNEAQSVARSISNRVMRDRVLVQIARRQTSEGRIDEAVAVALRIEDDTARVSALVNLAGAALASRDRVRAVELLDEAEAEAIKAQPTIARAQSLLTIAGSFSALDTVRAFEVMQTAIKSINEIPAPDGQKRFTGGQQPDIAAPNSADLYNLNFESTLAVLAQTDFDRALLLAQQLTIKDASLIAQLAVCRGGLARAPETEHAPGEEEAGEKH